MEISKADFPCLQRIENINTVCENESNKPETEEIKNVCQRISDVGL